MSHTLPDSSTGSVYASARIGVNSKAFHGLLAEWKTNADPAKRLGAYDQGLHHWPIIAASQGGVIDLTLDHRPGVDGRSYTVGAFPLQSMPSALRPAITPAVDGHKVIEADWRSSHWLHLAFASGDEVMISDLLTGDLYATTCPNFERKSAKIGMNAMLNGGGLPAMTRAFGGDAATGRAFRDHVRGLFKTRWPVAGRHLDGLRKHAVASGWADDEQMAAGVALSQLEAVALQMSVAATLEAYPAARLMVPMHDGVLLSAPDYVADEVASRLALEMAKAGTTGNPAAGSDPSVWVSVNVSTSWGGDTPTVIGNAARAEALKAVDDCADLGGLLLAAGAMTDLLRAAKAKHHHNSEQGRLVRMALSAHQDALRWFAGKARGDSGPEPLKLAHYNPSYTNLCRIIAEDGTLPPVSYDVRSNVALIGDERVTDTLLRSTYLPPLERRYGMTTVSEPNLGGALLDTAMANSFDPVLDYFNGLPAWDGTHRAAYWLQDFAGVQGPEPLIQAYSYKWLLSIVARAFEPGCKVDTLLVLLGAQGARKSTMLKAIAPGGSFADIAIDPHDKDSVLRASRYAVVEWGEMTGLSKRDQSALKAYFARPDDEVRPPYARADIKIPRRVVFAATTNVGDFLTDETGARRYWSVKVADNIDVQGLEAAKDQIWAEAVAIYRHLSRELSPAEAEDLKAQHPAGYESWAYKWWLSPAQVALKEGADEDFTVEDPHAPGVLRFAAGHKGIVRLDDLMTYLEIPARDFTRLKGVMISTLKRLKFESKRLRDEDGKMYRAWVAPEGLDLLPYANRATRSALTSSGYTFN